MIRIIPETGSTSADLVARQCDGDQVPEGEWLVALHQTAGRGRQGRQWFDGAGNFMGSTAVHLRGGDPPAPSLALVAGLAVHACLAPLVAQARLKWPNDVMVGEAKLAGILLERVNDAVIVGIGVNLAVPPMIEGRITTALSDHATPQAPQAFAETLATGFATELERWRRAGLEPIIRRWQDAAHPVGTPLAVSGEDGLVGTFAGLDATGALQLQLADGTTRTIQAGEVIFAHVQG